MTIFCCCFRLFKYRTRGKCLQKTMETLCYIKMTGNKGGPLFSPLTILFRYWRRRWEVRCGTWNVAGQTWESGFALAGNGYLRSWKWSGPFWHFHSPAGMSNLQCKTERLEEREGEMERETRSVRWGRNQGNRLHGRVKKWLETEFGRTVQAREINMDRKYLEVMEKCERRAQILTSRK